MQTLHVYIINKKDELMCMPFQKDLGVAVTENLS